MGMAPEKDHLLTDLHFSTSRLRFSQLPFSWAQRNGLRAPMRVCSRSENESQVPGSERGFWTLVFSADVIIQSLEAARPVTGGNSENIPFE